MRLIPSGLVCLALINVAYAAVALPADANNEQWIADFRKFSAQKNIGIESSYSPRSGNGSVPSLSDLLRALPDPSDWLTLRHALEEAAARVPADQEKERQRLQAGGWLLAYLQGDRAAIQTDSGAAIGIAEKAKSQGLVEALTHLKASLSGDKQSGQSPEKLIQQFEAQLIMLEPVNDDAVKKALGSAENFARLNRLIAIGREMQDRMAKIAKDYEIDKDLVTARSKAEALEKEYAKKDEEERKALEPYFGDPQVERYMDNAYREAASDESGTSGATLYVPDLVPVVGPERATALINRALRCSANLKVNDKLDPATLQLIRQLVMADMDQLKVPSWGLVQDVHSADLFEAFRRRFPGVTLKDDDYSSACGYYLASLLELNRWDEAVKFITSFKVEGDGANQIRLPYELIDELERNHADGLWRFLRGWLAANPSADEWDHFNRLSVQLDRRDDLKALIKTLAANGSFNGLNRLTVQRLQADSEMATGEIAEAADRLRTALQMPSATEAERKVQMDMVYRLLKLADLQHDQAGFDSALAVGKTLLEKDRAQKIENAFPATHELIAVLNELGHFAESARLGRVELDQVAILAKNAAAKKDPEGNPVQFPTYQFQDLLAGQLRSEVELGHWKEARALLQENPWWAVKDAAGLLGRSYSRNDKPVDYYVARIAEAEGDRALTRRILEAQLVATPAVDAVYSAYLDLVGKEALPLLEKLAVSDRYEERPLIWKARLQMDAKEWDAAIATLQQAIAIDPSDGEEGRGDRMRVYAFMSLAMTGKDDTAKATAYANIVKAIRISETADRWYEIGAYAKAIELYRDALGFFQDAYCIQSRLAIRLADAGKMDEAAEHYRRAFELMPDSFGRVESHCFGCERAFAGKKPQAVAEEVFNRMLQARPDKPQLHYLLGYLREEQERLPEAAENYRHAIQLDPLYLNAWKRLAELDGKLKFSPVQRDDLLLKLDELDPGQKHTSPDLREVTDLPRLWQRLKQSSALVDMLPVPAELWEFKASAARLEQAKDGGRSEWHEGRERKDFGAVLLEHDFVGALQIYMGVLNQESQESAEVALETN
ncbi:MAG TPA: hypothetical protein VGM64_06335 [Lacunisphaera sp.]|jgi:tetratricopeptide (TPR) repeat protein